MPRLKRLELEQEPEPEPTELVQKLEQDYELVWVFEHLVEQR